MRSTMILLTVFLFTAAALTAAESLATSKWEKDIQAFEAEDKSNPPPKNAIVFVGSSSIRLWKTLAQDFPKRPVINRGFGGSQVADAVEFADRIILPYRPPMVVVYAGDNDLAAGKSPEQVAADFQALVRKIRGKLPRVRIAYIAIKPSPSRWKLVEQIRTANGLIEKLTRTDKRLTFINVFTPMLGPDGQPREELFVSDRLHLNEKGYALWREIVGPVLK